MKITLASSLIFAGYPACSPRIDYSSDACRRARSSAQELQCPDGARPVEETGDGLITGKSLFCMKRGVKDGPFINSYRSGAKMGEGSYKNGRLHGRHTNYYESGCMMSTGIFRDGKTTGESMSWYPNGNQSEERKPAGNDSFITITTWHDNGKKQRQFTAKDGVPCGVILNWSPAGLPEPTDSYFEIFGCAARPDGALCPPCGTRRNWAAAH